MPETPSQTLTEAVAAFVAAQPDLAGDYKFRLHAQRRDGTTATFTYTSNAARPAAPAAPPD